MDSEMTTSLERAGAIERREGGLWGITKAGREMSALLAGLPRDPKDDGINFDYGEWKEADKAFDHAAYDAKRWRTRYSMGRPRRPWMIGWPRMSALWGMRTDRRSSRTRCTTSTATV